MDRDILLLLVGATIALVSSILTALAQHFLSLRAERIKRTWEKEEDKSQELRKSLTEGTRLPLNEVKRKVLSERIDEIGSALKNVGGGISSPEDLLEAAKLLEEIKVTLKNHGSRATVLKYIPSLY